MQVGVQRDNRNERDEGNKGGDDLAGGGPGGSEELGAESIDLPTLPDESLSPTLRRTADLACLGLGSEAPDLTDKIGDEILAKLSRNATEWLLANSEPITDIFHPNWVENFMARMNPPSVIALIDVKGIPDQAASELITKTLAGDPDSRLYGGCHGAFVARISPFGMMGLARLEAVSKIS